MTRAKVYLPGRATRCPAHGRTPARATGTYPKGMSQLQAVEKLAHRTSILERLRPAVAAYGRVVPSALGDGVVGSCGSRTSDWELGHLVGSALGVSGMMSSQVVEPHEPTTPSPSALTALGPLSWHRGMSLKWTVVTEQLHQPLHVAGEGGHDPPVSGVDAPAPDLAAAHCRRASACTAASIR